MIPDNVEKIIMTKEDYDRNVEQMLLEKLKLEQELQRKDNIINELKDLILNDINFPELCDREKIEDKFKELENE